VLLEKYRGEIPFTVDLFSAICRWWNKSIFYLGSGPISNFSFGRGITKEFRRYLGDLFFLKAWTLNKFCFLDCCCGFTSSFNVEVKYTLPEANNECTEKWIWLEHDPFPLKRADFTYFQGQFPVSGSVNHVPSWRIIPGLGYVVNNHGDRFRPLWVWLFPLQMAFPCFTNEGWS